MKNKMLRALKNITYYASGIVTGGAIASLTIHQGNFAIVLGVIAAFLVGEAIALPDKDKEAPGEKPGHVTPKEFINWECVAWS